MIKHFSRTERCGLFAISLLMVACGFARGQSPSPTPAPIGRYKDISVRAINDVGMTIGSAEYVPSGPNDPNSAGTHNVLLIQVTLSCPKADTKVSPDTNPAFFNSPSPPDPTLSKSREPALVVFYREVIDSAFVVQPFTVTTNFGPNLGGVTWAQSAGPSGVGHFEDANQAIARFVDPNVGGLFQFDATFPGSPGVRTSLILPLAGAEIKDVVATDMAKANTFAAAVVAKYGIFKRNLPTNGLRWFYNGGAGDYLGRPDNKGSKTCARFNPVNDIGGMGAVATWFGVPVRISKASNFLVGYATKKIGVFAFFAWLSQTLGTNNDASATASFDLGTSIAAGTKTYSADTYSMLKANFYNSDVKNTRLWPNTAPADNHVYSSTISNFNTQFCSPAFTEMTHP